MKHFIIEDLQTGVIRVSKDENVFYNAYKCGFDIKLLISGKSQTFTYDGDFFKIYFIEPYQIPFVGCFKFGEA